MEKWLPIDGHPGYEVSNLGNVRSIPRIIVDSNGVSFRKKGRVLKPGRRGTSGRYLGVQLGFNCPANIHYLVCTAFHGPRPTAKHEAAHIDGNSHNNIAENLVWATKRENENHKIKHGTILRGEDHGRAKLTEDDVLAIRRMITDGATTAETARAFEISWQSVHLIKQRKSWTWLRDTT